MQLALSVASRPGGNGRVYIPAGTYRITDTLRLQKKVSLIVRGDGGASKFSPQFNLGGKTTCLAWDGPAGGTLVHLHAVGGSSFRDFNLSGRLPGNTETEDRAGILLQTSSGRGWSTMLNTFDNVGFYHADMGICMGEDSNEPTNADQHFQNVIFHDLGTGFRVSGPQGVDYMFTFLFVCNTGTVLDFRRGGNLLVNSAQITKCDVFLNIGAGGKMGGAYLCNNVRLESSGGGRTMRHQLLRTKPTGGNCTVRFAGYNDCQWAWCDNKTADRAKPLCEIGPGASVVFENSIFLSPVATVKGREGSPARLVMRDCSFWLPQDLWLTANRQGYVQTVRSHDGRGRPLPDIVKWPEIEPIRIDADADYLEAKRLWREAAE